jgi:hypothetical protein
MKNKIFFFFLFLLSIQELLKGPGYMQKMNEIYFENPHQYKVKQLEIKRMKQIDKKLKQYYSNNQAEFYKTCEPLQNDSKNRTKLDANLFLLKDLNKLDNTQQQQQQQQQSNLNRQLSEPVQTLGESVNISYPIVNNNNNNNNHQNKSNINVTPKINRFRVEKINEII